MKILKLSVFLFLLGLVVSCNETTNKNDVSKESSTVKEVTKVTDENYGLAETQVIFTDYVKKIAKDSKTNGVGVFKHDKKPLDPKQRTIMRINFDTQYSFAVLDLTDDATLIMPETNGRYQSAWIITEEHYNPLAFNKPGKYKITKKIQVLNML